MSQQHNPIAVLCMFTCLVGFTCIAFVAGCGQQGNKADSQKTVEKIDSFEKIEQEILRVKSQVQEVDAKERVYYDLFIEREHILRIAEGNYNNQSNFDRAMIRKMAWVMLGEIQERRPDFEVLVERGQLPQTLPEEQPKEEQPNPDIEKLPEEFQ